MSRKEKLIKRLLCKPKDFTYQELCTLLGLLDFVEDVKGKTSGSRVAFVNKTDVIYLHKPHNRKNLLEYQIKEVIEKLKSEGLI